MFLYWFAQQIEKMSSKEKYRREIIVHKYLENPTASFSSIAKSVKISASTVRDVINRLKERNTVDRKIRSRKVDCFNPKLMSNVVSFMKRYPNRSLRYVAQKFGTNLSFVFRAKKKSGLRSYCVEKHPRRDEKGRAKAKLRARKLYDQFLTKNEGCLVMDDESYIFADFQQLPGKEFYIATKRYGVAERFRKKCLTKFAKKYLVWQAICCCGARSKVFVTTGSINSEIYMKECLQKRLLPFLNSHNKSPLFWPDLATCHYSNAVMRWYAENGVRVVPKEANPPNCPELRPIEKYWGICKGILRRTKKFAKNEKSFKRYWKNAAKSVPNSSVQRMMQAVKSRVRRFAYEDNI